MNAAVLIPKYIIVGGSKTYCTEFCSYKKDKTAELISSAIKRREQNGECI